jgi:acyl-CoA dehydrogenase
MVLFALRTERVGAISDVRKIPTFGIRSAFVGEFDVAGYEFPAADIIAEQRGAWDAVFGTVGLGKFFLGFGAIGICERAFEEAWMHVTSRRLYGKPVVQMPHIRLNMARAYIRLAAMKLYAYRAVDYFQCASETDRRYLLYAAVQKAKVSTDGVRVIDLLLECIGARGFESDTYFEMASRDIRLLPVLEGSSHINFALAAQFMEKFFDGSGSGPPSPAAWAAEDRAEENEYLFAARSVSPKSVTFASAADSFQNLERIDSARTFSRQFAAFRSFARSFDSPVPADDTETAVALGKCVSTLVFAQLVAEHVSSIGAPDQIVSLIFDQLVEDISTHSLHLAGTNGISDAQRDALMHLVSASKSKVSDVEFVIEWIAQRAKQ